MSNNGKKTPKQSEEHNESGPCWGPEQREECCPEIDNAEFGCFSGAEMPNVMEKCFSRCWYFPLFPMVLGTILLLLGYFLSPEVTRALWMIGAGTVLGMGLFGLLAMRRIAAKISSSGCC